MTRLWEPPLRNKSKIGLNGSFSRLFLFLFLFVLVGCIPSEEDRAQKASLGILRGSLGHENFFVRSASIKALGEMGDPKFVSDILPGFRDPIAFVRLFSVESVAQLHGPDTIKILLAAGADPDPMVRVAVVKAFDDLADSKGKVDSVPIGQLMTSFIKDPDATVHLFAQAALIRQGNNQGWPDIVNAARSPDTASPAIVALGRTKKKAALSSLIPALTFSDPMIRTLAAEALGEIAAQEAYTPLVERIVEDKETTVRGAVATSLGKIGDSRATPILTPLLNDPEPMVQLSAAEGLMRLGIKRWEVYERGLRHADYGVRHFAIGSLHKIGDKAALPLLKNALSDQAPRVRIAAVRAIGALGGKQEAPLLEKMLNDPDLSVRAYAAGNRIRLLRESKNKRT